MKITVLGSGGWGTALALLLLDNGNDVTLWSYAEAQAALLEERRENPRLAGVPLPPELKLTASMDCLAESALVVMAVPSFAVRETARRISEKLGYQPGGDRQEGRAPAAAWNHPCVRGEGN